MIQFYVERQQDDRLKASFFRKPDGFGGLSEPIGCTKNISLDQIDSAVEDIFPDSQKTQIFEMPDVV